MKIALASDIHLEFGDITLTNDGHADILVLAGDICVASDAHKDNYQGERIRNFFQRVSQDFPQVIYIMGNHEHYDGDWAKSQSLLQDMLSGLHLDNVQVLEKETAVINDVTFVCGTLWTNFNKSDPLTMWHARQSMNEYKICRNSLRGYSGGGFASRLQPEDTLKDHQTMLDYIDIVVSEKPGQRFVIVGHHAPCSASVAEMYKEDTLMNGNFYSDLTEFIMNRPQIKLWLHGHMHNNSDYMLGSTRVVCNPRGYVGHEERADRFKLQYVEIE
jgi:Icc-related predicted phosphoesterase